MKGIDIIGLLLGRIYIWKRKERHYTQLQKYKVDVRLCLLSSRILHSKPWTI